ncbi:M48 family metallopeptidase [Swingsia samuiensis]|uniref:M48 family peptidase n=1 Tax=Swingsia samuiensis TaxID=1293412 RepID=A0A4Y6ULC4_9PROT|nr:SprT family zinc-dependent metalloprotease [Swingsia samuiensis]QDH17157.1 M48 family peptidase [Swingsia samuiensis]
MPSPPTIPIIWNPSKRARRLSLRIDPVKGAVVITLPYRMSQKQGMGFLQENIEWIERNFAALPQKTPLTDGYSVPIEGVDHTIHHMPHAHRGCWIEQNNLYVSGDAAHTERRVKEFLKTLARIQLTKSIRHYSEQMELYPSRLDFRDTRSRWGSCTRQGRIMLNWRLIMAPPEISTYVVIHELSHLKFFDHGKDFWTLVEKNYEKDGRKRLAAERWLSNNGARLLRSA